MLYHDIKKVPPVCIAFSLRRATLELLLVMKQQMQVFKISLVLTWSNASGAGQSNFIGFIRWL
jgi:hypothetical protein